MTMHMEPQVLPQAAMRQSLANVTIAESRRLVRKGGVPTLMGLALVVGIACGICAMLIMRSLEPEVSSLTVTVPVEVAAFTSNLVLAVAAVFAVGRDHLGLLGISLSITPNRRRLFVARNLSWVLISAVVTAAIAMFLLAIGMIVLAGQFVGPALIGSALAIVGSSSMVLIAVAIAHVVGRAFGAVLILVGLNVVLPLVVAIASTLVSESVAKVAMTLIEQTPTSLFIQATNGANITNLGLSGVLSGQIGLAFWWLILGGIAYLFFQRRSY